MSDCTVCLKIVLGLGSAELGLLACGAAGSVNIVPNWHDMKRRAVPFSLGWRSR